MTSIFPLYSKARRNYKGIIATFLFTFDRNSV